MGGLTKSDNCGRMQVKLYTKLSQNMPSQHNGTEHLTVHEIQDESIERLKQLTVGGQIQLANAKVSLRNWKVSNAIQIKEQIV